MITEKELKSVMAYSEETGEFSWIPKPRNKRKRWVAGGRTMNGYITIRLNKKAYLAHRLAFLYMTGDWPTHQVDHINRVRDDNRWCNLREATSSENNCNRSNRQGVGIYEIERKGRPGVWYIATIQKDNKIYSITRRCKKSAETWRGKKQKELFGEFDGS